MPRFTGAALLLLSVGHVPAMKNKGRIAVGAEVRDGKLVKGAMPGRPIRSTSTTP